tara:strand:- start:45 stop:515 length:471 start_codon:yes stop_codon:yes gene_type:complete
MIKEKNKNLRVHIIKDDLNEYIPSDYKIKKWARNSFIKSKISTVVIKITSASTMKKIKYRFFNNKSVSNVLSFPNTPTSLHISNNLGDIVICASIVNKESKYYMKKNDNRWAHMITHSMLHLQGYDHTKKKERDIMEKQEIKLMSKLGLSNPYNAE